MGRISAFFKELFFPTRCFVCGKVPDEESDNCLCRTCRNRYARERFMPCSVCHMKYEDCTCRPRFASPFIEGYARVMKYRDENVAGRLVLAAKDLPAPRLNAFLASEMAKVIRKREFKPDIVTFVPCSDDSFCKKGFDHGEELAKALSEALGIPLVKCFESVSTGKTQKQLSAEARLANSRDAIRSRKRIEVLIQGKNVLLMDDILTTGASALVASVYLKDNGAKKVDFVSFGAR